MPVFSTGGLLRDVALSAEVAAILLALQFAVVIFNEWRQLRTRRWSDLRMGWGSFLALAALHLVFFVVADFYTFTTPDREFWIRLGYIALQAGLTVLSFTIERILPYRTFHVFSGICAAGVAFSVFLPHWVLQLIALGVLTPVVLIELLLFAYYTLKTVRGVVRIAVGSFLVAFLLVILGYGLTSDAAKSAWGEPSYAIGAIVLAAGCVGMGVALLNIPSFDEMNWGPAVRELYVLTRDGVSLLSLDFSKRQVSTMETDALLASSGIAGVRGVMKEIMGTEEEIRVVDQGTLKMLFAYGPHVIGVLVSTKPLETLVVKLATFVHNFELLFAGALDNFDGNVMVFKPAQRMALAEFTQGAAPASPLLGRH
jgi:hypothetical protein